MDDFSADPWSEPLRCHYCGGRTHASPSMTCDDCRGMLEAPAKRQVHEYIPVAVVFPSEQIKAPYTCWTEATDEWWFDLAYKAQVRHAQALARVLRGRCEVL